MFWCRERGVSLIFFFGFIRFHGLLSERSHWAEISYTNGVSIESVPIGGSYFRSVTRPLKTCTLKSHVFRGNILLDSRYAPVTGVGSGGSVYCCYRRRRIEDFVSERKPDIINPLLLLTNFTSRHEKRNERPGPIAPPCPPSPVNPPPTCNYRGRACIFSYL